MDRQQFRQLLPGQLLQERRGPTWTVHAPPYQQDGLAHVVLVAGARVRHVPEHFCDGYMLLDLPDSTS